MVLSILHMTLLQGYSALDASRQYYLCTMVFDTTCPILFFIQNPTKKQKPLCSSVKNGMYTNVQGINLEVYSCLIMTPYNLKVVKSVICA